MSNKQKLDNAVDALYSALTCTLEDNGNIMADAVRDHLLNTLSEITGKPIDEIEGEIDIKIEESQ